MEAKKGLWLPEGSIRGLIALGIVGTFCYLCVIKAIPNEALIPIVMIVMKEYSDNRRKDNEEAKSNADNDPAISGS